MVTVVALVFLVGHLLTRHIHLATDDRFEFLFIGFAGILFLNIIEKFLYAEHVAMVGNCKCGHAVSHSLVYEGVD